MNHQKIIIDQISVQAHVGITEQERNLLQEMRWRVEIVLDSSIDFSKDLNSSKYVCYDKLVQMILEFSKSKKFKLIESMASECFHLLKKEFDSIQSLKLALQKVNPPISNIKGGVIFECTDDKTML